MTTSLYDEVIAEAKQLREVAEQNAKNAIIEAVTPKIRQFIEDQLLNDGKSIKDNKENQDVLSETISELLSSDEIGGEEVVIDESALSSLINLLGEGDDVNLSTSSVRQALRETVGGLTSSERHKLTSAASKIKQTANSLSSKRIDINETILENPTMSRNKNDVLYEVDLDSLSSLIEQSDDSGRGSSSPKQRYADEADLADALREASIVMDLGDDLDVESLQDILGPALGTAQLSLEVGEEDEGADMDDEELDLDLDMDMDDMEMEDMPVDEPEEEVLDEVYDIDPRMLKSEIRRLRRNLAEVASGLHDAKGGTDSKESSFGGAGSSAAGLKNVWGGKSGKKGDDFGGGSRSGDVLEAPPTMNKLAEVKKLRRKLQNEGRRNRALQDRLKQYRSAVETLREQ